MSKSGREDIIINGIKCLFKVDKNSTKKYSLSRCFLIKSTRPISAWIVEWLFLNPNCFSKSILCLVKNEYGREYMHFSYNLLKTDNTDIERN